MPRAEAVLETSLYVADLDRAVRFYRDVLGFRLMDRFDEGRGAAFAVGSSVLLLFSAEVSSQPGTIPPHGARGPIHAAFRVRAEELPAWRAHLERHGVAIEHEQVFGANPPSIYFRDPDGNSLEFAVASIWPLDG
jgi:catechol 2,3-dioxygenase-like lactoylglutathione lyase family enzyme